MSYLITPEGYKPLLDLKQTALGIKQIKEFFQLNLSSEMRLRRVTAPLFVLKGMGINDDLNGVEQMCIRDSDNWMMSFTEKLLERICIAVNGCTETEIDGKTISFKAPYRRLPILEAIKEKTCLLYTSRCV